ncbi:MAG: peroxiredoxin [Azoarcus sp.]|nr:peroxiredoxin [Azoarcus sp.]
MTPPTLPDLSLPATGGKEVNLSDLRGTKLVLYFYPRDNTPACAREAREFTALYAAFAAAGHAIFGVSRDRLASHEKFKAQLGLPFELLSDTGEALCEAFGVMKLKNVCGKRLRGIERSTFVFDAEGALVRTWRGVKVPGHAEDVLAFVRRAGLA